MLGTTRPVTAEPEIEVRARRTRPYGAVVSLRGEHDIASLNDVRAALAPLRGHVLVDLTRCEFIETTVMGALIGKSIEPESTVELALPPEGSEAARAIEVFGLVERLGVDEPAAASASTPNAAL